MADAIVACPACGKQFRRPASAAEGQRMRCLCGEVFAVGDVVSDDAPGGDVDAALGGDEPSDLGLDEPVESYELDESEQVEATVPAPPTLLSMTDVVDGDDDEPERDPSSEEQDNPRKVVGRSAVEQALLDRQFDAPEPLFRDRYLPAMLIAIGLIVQVVLCLAWLPTTGWRVRVLAVSFAAQAFLFLPAMFGSLLLATRWFGFDLGTPRVAVLKMVALVVGPAAVADVLHTTALVAGGGGVGYLLAGLAVFFIMVVIPLIYLFEMDRQDAAVVTIMNFFVHAVAALAMSIWLEPLIGGGTMGI